MDGATLIIPSVQDQVSSEEWEVRVQLAAAYRLAAHFGWDDLIYTHISARVPGSGHDFLINPFGLMFDEITASSLVKVDLNGEKLLDNPFPVNKAGFVIHSTIHKAREEAQTVMHLHTDYGIAVSNLKDGLTPHSQTAIPPYSVVGYHDYEGFAVNDDERGRIVADIGDKSAIILRNHGTLTIGKSVPKAFELMYFLEKACRIQVLTHSTGLPVHKPSDQALEQAIHDLSAVAGTDGADNLLWPALMRKLDKIDPSYRN